MKCLGLISFVGEISRQPTIDHVLWSLVIILVWIHNEKGQGEVKKKHKINGLRRKKTAGDCEERDEEK